jgi:hypothetical protein
LNTLNIDSNDGELESALWAVGQFLVRTPQSDAGVARLMQQFGRLSSGNQRALMELVYGLYPNEFITEAKRIVQQTDHPKLFAQTASYLYRADASLQNWLLQLLPKRFPNYSSHDLLIALQQHLQKSNAATLPALDSLFAHQQLHKFKVVYSFQRSHRNAPGIAVVQQADGRFAKDEQGQLKIFCATGPLCQQPALFHYQWQYPAGFVCHYRYWHFQKCIHWPHTQPCKW